MTTSNQKEKEEEPIISSLQYRQGTSHDLPTIHELESISYPPDEAASLRSLTYRMENAPAYFLICTLDTQVIGFICSTRCHCFQHESMFTHDPSGHILGIHSIVVKEEYRQKGIGTELMKKYLDWIPRDGLTKIVLLAKPNLLPFYVNAGFGVTCLSDIEHGSESWYYLEMDLLSKRECFVVDSFADVTEEGYIVSGNPAGVVLMEGDDPEKERNWMQNVAKEFNHSETAFVWKKNQREFHLRYYTSAGVEVDLCGHATLASAAVLFMQPDHRGDKEFTFHLKKDVLRALRCVDDSGKNKGKALKIAMCLPWINVQEITDTKLKDSILSNLLDSLLIVSQNILFLGVDEYGQDLIVEMTSEVFFSLPQNTGEISFPLLKSCPGHNRGITICCSSQDATSGVDFYSRFFGPKVGIEEDPVTGSAHCFLGPYFGGKLNKHKVLGKQLSQRGGIVECHLQQEDKERRVCITGVALKTISGVLHV